VVGIDTYIIIVQFWGRVLPALGGQGRHFSFEDSDPYLSPYRRAFITKCPKTGTCLCSRGHVPTARRQLRRGRNRAHVPLPLTSQGSHVPRQTVAYDPAQLLPKVIVAPTCTPIVNTQRSYSMRNYQSNIRVLNWTWTSTLSVKVVYSDLLRGCLVSIINIAQADSA
jgi:hypothetical protein